MVKNAILLQRANNQWDVYKTGFRSGNRHEAAVNSSARIVRSGEKVLHAHLYEANKTAGEMPAGKSIIIKNFKTKN